MSRDQFEAAFAATLAEVGAPYLQARQTILFEGSAALPWLEAKRASTADWNTILHVDILTGWLKSRSQFELCLDYIRGNLPGSPPITGTFTPVQRADAVAGLGAEVTPRLLEMILKSDEAADPKERASVFGALTRLRDRRAVPPLIALLGPERDPALRRSAAGALGHLEDARAVPPLLSLLRNPSETENVRCSAATSLGFLGAREASSTMQEVLLSPASGLELRKAVVGALDQLGDTRAAQALNEALPRSDDLVLLQLVIEALGKLGGPSSLGALERLARDHPDAFIKDAARDAAASIRGRHPGTR